MRSRVLSAILYAAAVGSLAGCASGYFPGVGPDAETVRAGGSEGLPVPVQLVEVDTAVAARLAEQRRIRPFSDTLGHERPRPVIGSGDLLEINIWEAPPATLFGGGPIDARAPSTTRALALPEQMVDHDGFVAVPFAGRVKAAGLTPHALGEEIATRLRGKANQPDVIVRVLRSAASSVAIVGDVANSTRLTLTAGGERLLDALAAAGGVRQPITKISLQVTRGPRFHSMPLDMVIRDPAQNVPLLPGDVVTALFQPLSFTALGATGKNDEIAFEAQGISLAQALARSGGLIDTRSNPQGVFVFRYERADALQWARQPAATPDGRVPVVYRLDLRHPGSFLVMQNFVISDRDVLYVSNAPAADLQKFLNLVFSVVYPVISTIDLTTR